MKSAKIYTLYQDLLDKLKSDSKFFESLRKYGFFVSDLKSRRSIASGVMEVLGHKSKFLTMNHFVELVHPEDREAYINSWSRLEAGFDDVFFAEYRLRDGWGNYHWLQTQGVVLERTSQGEISFFAGVDRNITLRKDTENLILTRYSDLEDRYYLSESLRVAGSVVASTLDREANLQVILEQAQGLIPCDFIRLSSIEGYTLHILGQKGKVEGPETRDVSPVWKVVSDKVPRIIDDLGAIIPPHPGDEKRIFGSWMGVPLVFKGNVVGALEFWNWGTRSFHGDQIWPAMAFADSVAIGISNASRFEQSTEEGLRDGLTGLSSRAKFQKTAENIFQTCLQGEEDLGVIMTDLDHFKRVNDQNGHPMGDTVLQTFAQICRQVLRKSDMIFRFGGEEFIILLPGSQLDAALNIAERIRKLFETSVIEGLCEPVTASFGVASLMSQSVTTLGALVAKADQALYQAKNTGRNRVCKAN